MPSLGNVLLLAATAMTTAACSGTQNPSQDDSTASIEVADTAETKQPELIAIGAVAPDFTLDTIDGETFTLKDLRGRVVVLDFWTTWCLGCVQELPIMNEFAEWADQEELPITVVAINTFPNKNQELHLKQVRTYLTNHDIELAVVLDPLDTPVAKEYGVRAFPSNVIIDQEGVVTATGVGMKHPYIQWLKDNTAAAMH